MQKGEVQMINVKFTATELLGFDELMEKVNDECSGIMLMYKKYGKINEFSDILRDYFCTEITHDEPIEIKDIEAFISSYDCKINLLTLITVKETEPMDIVLLFEYLSIPDNICDFLAYIYRMNEFDTLLEMMVKYNKHCYGLDVDTKDVTLDDIRLCIRDYTDFGNVFIHMKKDFDIKNK